MDETRWIWWFKQLSGPFTVAQLGRLAKDREIDHRTLFWSERLQQWLPLRGLLFDLFPDRVTDMRKAGIQRVRVLGSGTAEECSACKRLADQTYPIEHPPVLPPGRCSCNPWCRCVIITA
jgi:hypothetical protein